MTIIEKHLNTYSGEVSTAKNSFFTRKIITEAASEDNNIFEGINANAFTWNTILDSLQTTYFLALGRIFDIDDKTFSVHFILRSCIQNIEQFSLNALAERKIRFNNGATPEWLNDYLRNSYVPQETDFQKLKSEVKKFNSRFIEACKPIRHRVYAHLERESIGKISELFEKAEISEIQSIIEFTYQIESVLWELLHNGKLYPTSEFSLSEEGRGKSDVKNLLNKIKLPSHND